uniref:hypothetical protein n=1 Tax=Elmerina hispida TaxID=1245649 RepID=UPI003002B054|nr:hypothetical protein [Elmerina hispida]
MEIMTPRTPRLKKKIASLLKEKNLEIIPNKIIKIYPHLLKLPLIHLKRPIQMETQLLALRIQKRPIPPKNPLQAQRLQEMPLQMEVPVVLNNTRIGEVIWTSL